MKTILLLLAVCSQATITAPTEVEQYKPIVVAAVTTADPGSETQYIWKSSTTEFIAVDNNKTLHIWAKPGTHKIDLTAVTINWEAHKFLLESKEVTFTVKGAINPPDPPNPPTPGTAVAALVIYEKDQLTAKQALILNSVQNTEVGRKKVKFLDKDARTTSEQPYLTAVNAHIGNKPLPVVVAIAEDSSLGDVVELPATSQNFTALLTSWGIK